MADFSALKQSIETYIKNNGNKEITGAILQNILLSMVTTMGDGAINDNVSDISDISSPSAWRTSSSVSQTGRPSARPSSFAITLFPHPGIPTRTMFFSSVSNDAPARIMARSVTRRSVKSSQVSFVW